MKKSNSKNSSGQIDLSGLSLINKKYKNIIQMGKEKPASDKPKLNSNDYVDIHI